MPDVQHVCDVCWFSAPTAAEVEAHFRQEHGGELTVLGALSQENGILRALGANGKELWRVDLEQWLIDQLGAGHPAIPDSGVPNE